MFIGCGICGAGAARGFGALKGLEDIGVTGTGGFEAATEGMGICEMGVNEGAFGIGVTVFNVSGVISVIVLAGSGTGGSMGGLLFSLP